MAKQRWIKWAILVVLLIAATGAILRFSRRNDQVPEGIASGNGRIEATEVDIATKLAGRLAEVMVREGDMVQAGQIVARMDTYELMAQMRMWRREFQIYQADLKVRPEFAWHRHPSPYQ